MQDSNWTKVNARYKSFMMNIYISKSEPDRGLIVMYAEAELRDWNLSSLQDGVLAPSRSQTKPPSPANKLPCTVYMSTRVSEIPSLHTERSLGVDSQGRDKF